MAKTVQLFSPPSVALVVETSLAAGRNMLLGISRYVREHGPWLIHHEPRSLGESLPNWFKHWKGDGIIARIQHQRIADQVLSMGVPVVDVLGMLPGLSVPLVHVDNIAIGRVGAQHFLERGFRNFGFCGIADANWASERQEGFVQTLKLMGYSCEVFAMPTNKKTGAIRETHFNKLTNWLKKLPKPVAIMGPNDPPGRMILEACRETEILVPDEVAVLGVNNDEPLCEMATPPLSSMLDNTWHVGYEAAALLDRMIQGEPAPTEPILLGPADIVTRQSSDVLAVPDTEVVRAVRFIRQHFRDGINVADVVDNAFVSRTELTRRFNHYLGHPIKDEITRVKINRIKQLLIHSDLPLKVIAEKVGFDHIEYMGATFKANVGKTPAQYRRETKR